jgi:hypothetical protein
MRSPVQTARLFTLVPVSAAFYCHAPKLEFSLLPFALLLKQLHINFLTLIELLVSLCCPTAGFLLVGGRTDRSNALSAPIILIPSQFNGLHPIVLIHLHTHYTLYYDISTVYNTVLLSTVHSLTLSTYVVTESDGEEPN